MKILVATELTQGARKNDFCFVEEGEVVTFGSECDGESVDGHCGCKRSMIGVVCGKATTTIRVVDIPAMTEERMQELVHNHLVTAGWANRIRMEDLAAWIADDARELLRLAACFDAGVILEKRGKKYVQRRAT